MNKMTLQEAIRTLEYGAWLHSLNYDMMSDADKNPLLEALNMAIAALRAQQEAEKNEPLTIEELHKAAPEWISVKDKLPEEYEDANGELINYLCYMPKYGVDIANYIKPARVWVCVGIPTKVTYWMPLPQPPEMEE